MNCSNLSFIFVTTFWLILLVKFERNSYFLELEFRFFFCWSSSIYDLTTSPTSVSFISIFPVLPLLLSLVSLFLNGSIKQKLLYWIDFALNYHISNDSIKDILLILLISRFHSPRKLLINHCDFVNFIIFNRQNNRFIEKVNHLKP